MTAYFTTTVDKFTFKVAKDRYYSQDGVWALAEGSRVRIGVSDFVQQRSGDVAFAEVTPEGTKLSVGDEVAALETIKVNVEVPSPLNGLIAEVNPLMETEPEKINLDPYGEGWLAVIEAGDWEADCAHLLEAETYFESIKVQAEQEVAGG